MPTTTEERKSLSVEELLLPRYKVIADYPGNLFKVGAVYTEKEFVDIHFAYDSEYLYQFPHLFKEVEWWQFRTPEQMPDYVKMTAGYRKGYVFKALRFDNDMVTYEGFDGIPYSTFAFEPSTREEYEAQQQKS